MRSFFLVILILGVYQNGAKAATGCPLFAGTYLPMINRAKVEKLVVRDRADCTGVEGTLKRREYSSEDPFVFDTTGTPKETWGYGQPTDVSRYLENTVQNFQLYALIYRHNAPFCPKCYDARLGTPALTQFRMIDEVTIEVRLPTISGSVVENLKRAE